MFKNTPSSTKTMLGLGATAAAFALSAVTPAPADSITWNFNSPSGVLNTSQNYSAISVPGGNTITVTAYGYSSKNTSTDLYGKNAGTGETGLGLAGESYNEINNPGFIQVDLSNLINNGKFTDISVMMGSLSPPNDSFILYASDTLGTNSGTQVASGGYLASGKKDTQTVGFTLPGNFSDSTPYLTVYSSQGSVLLESLTANSTPIPEPATLGLLGLGGLGLLGRRRKRVES